MEKRQENRRKNPDLKDVKRTGRKRSRKKITQIHRATFIELDEVSHPGEFLALVFFLNSV